MRAARHAAVVLAVIAATLAGGYLALVSFRQDRTLDTGTIKLSVSPGHRGALDLYVPLVDWGARFETIRLPVRLRVDVRSVDRSALQRVANNQPLDVAAVRSEATDAIARYLCSQRGQHMNDELLQATTDRVTQAASLIFRRPGACLPLPTDR